MFSDSGKYFGFWEVFLDSGTCFLVSGTCFLVSGTCFWILGRVFWFLGRVFWFLGRVFWFLGSVLSLRATVDRQSRSMFQRTVFFKQVSLMEFHFFQGSETAGHDYHYYFCKPSSSVLEPAYLFWLTLNMCHLSNASLSLADTFICIHFCHWIRNMQKRVIFSFIFRHYFAV